MTEAIPKTPLLIGLLAARANLVPGLFIQAMMVLLVLGFFHHPPTQEALARLAEIKVRSGYWFSVVITSTAAAILPELFQIAFVQGGKPRRKNLSTLVFTIPFWGMNGFILDLFYQLQSVWFGHAPDAATITRKVLVDQFIYNPFFAAPYQMWCYEWKRQGYSTRGLSRVFTPRFYTRRIVPVLIATWGVWLPICAVVYALPLPLQVPVVGLAMTFWVLMYTFIVTDKAPGRIDARPLTQQS